MIEGALILLAGILLGTVLGRLPARRRDPGPAGVEAVCGCTHHFSYHDPETGACNASVAVDKRTKNGSWVGYEYEACACLRYAGPEPLPTYIATEITGEGG